jgi:hypothetical protein
LTAAAAAAAAAAGEESRVQEVRRSVPPIQFVNDNGKSIKISIKSISSLSQ